MIDNDTFQLVMGRGPEPGKVYELPRSSVTLGRDPGNAVTVNDPQVSRQHARITPQGGLLVIEDLGSTNGTTINGVLIDAPYQLVHGDEIGLGDNVSFIFYGRFAGAADRTLASQPVSHTEPPRPPAPVQEPQEPAPPAYEAVPPAHEPSPPAREAVPPAEPDYGPVYADYPEYETGRDWTRLAWGCLAVVVMAGLFLTVLLYFFAPYSFWKAVEDFIQGLGLSIEITKQAMNGLSLV